VRTAFLLTYKNNSLSTKQSLNKGAQGLFDP